MKATRIQMFILLLIALLLSGWDAFGQDPRDVDKTITVTTVQSKDVTGTQRYPCRIQAHRRIEVRAPAEGYIATISIKEGQAVKTGDMMFGIQPILHKARLDARLAERNIARLELDSVKKLAEKQGASQAETKVFEAKLAKAQAEADLASAELELTSIKAPFDGLVGRLSRHLGSFVLKGETLTTLSDNSMMWVYFNMPESGYLEYMADRRENQQGEDPELFLANGGKFQHTGKLNAVEAEFDTETGTIAFRADFPNPEGLLRHGQSGMLRISRVQKDAVVIPKRAAVGPVKKPYVYVVDKDQVAHRREIVIQNETEDLFVVKKGVNVGDKIVVDGATRIRNGHKVE